MENGEKKGIAAAVATGTEQSRAPHDLPPLPGIADFLQGLCDAEVTQDPASKHGDHLAFLVTLTDSARPSFGDIITHRTPRTDAMVDYRIEADALDFPEKLAAAIMQHSDERAEDKTQILKGEEREEILRALAENIREEAMPYERKDEIAALLAELTGGAVRRDLTSRAHGHHCYYVNVPTSEQPDFGGIRAHRMDGGKPTVDYLVSADSDEFPEKLAAAIAAKRTQAQGATPEDVTTIAGRISAEAQNTSGRRR